MDEKHNMTEKPPVTVPYVVYSDTVANYHWVIKKLVIALVIVVALMFVSNMAWLWVFQSYDYATEETVTTLESDGNSVANYTGGNGGVNYGSESNGQENDPNENPE